METIKIIECPRDAMQGIKAFVPTDRKVAYIQSLLQVGFDTLDFGSFVSPKVIPQMQDTAAVLEQLDLSKTQTKLLTIIANTQGALIAAQHQPIHYLGFPFSISENFQMRNTHKTIAQSISTLDDILQIAYKSNKEVVVYLSMGFGNPYGDPWTIDIVSQWTEKLSSMGVKTLSLSDTIGNSTPEAIRYLFSNLIPKYTQIEFGAHLHSTPDKWFEKVDAAYQSGCRRFDGAIQGFGGCPMASNTLTGNMPTEKLVSYFTSIKEITNINSLSFESSYNEALKLFSAFH
jgi:hydroxymethylglutaryl-CoA lyase